MVNNSASTNVPKWLAFSGRLLEAFREFHDVTMPRQEDGGVSDVHLLGYSLLARTCSNFAGVKVLVTDGLVIEARTLARSCIENSFYIVGLLKDGDAFVKQLAAADIASRGVRGQTILERHAIQADDEAFDEGDKKGIREFLKSIRAAWPNAGSIEPKKLTKKGPLARAYLIYSQLSADAAHPSIESLNRYVTRESGTATLNYAGPPSNNELVDTLTWACLGSIGAFIAGSELLQAAKLNEKIAARAEEYNRLANLST